jgi:biotin-dependent carboxylase-like uncharacterized protein
MEIFRVHAPGPFSTLQDLGRFGFQHMGVPPSGALDPFAHTAANLLVGNAPDCATLEITFSGPHLEVLGLADIAVTGAEMDLRVNDAAVPQWASIRVGPGDRVRLGQASRGCRAYLAVSGGFSVPEVMGSRSTFVSAGLGGVDGRAIRAGDLLVRNPGRLLLRQRRLPWYPLYGSEIHLRAVPGPQDEYFRAGLGVFFSSTFTVTDKANRMGCRLEGPDVPRDAGAPQSIISEPVIPGNVQVPADGRPIILMVEQTIGGYAKIATVVTADLFKIAQAGPGDRIRFHPVTLEAAHVLYREWIMYLKNVQEVLETSQNALAP